MLQFSFVLSLSVSVDVTLTLGAVTALVTLVGKGLFAYYLYNKIRKEA